MYLTKKTKETLFKKHGKNEKDTGSAEGQIALFTLRINHLTEHLKNNRKDYIQINDKPQVYPYLFLIPHPF